MHIEDEDRRSHTNGFLATKPVSTGCGEDRLVPNNKFLIQADRLTIGVANTVQAEARAKKSAESFMRA